MPDTVLGDSFTVVIKKKKSLTYSTYCFKNNGKTSFVSNEKSQELYTFINKRENIFTLQMEKQAQRGSELDQVHTVEH